jgi:hypothetical protein
MLNHLKSLLNLETLVILALAAIALALPGTMDPAAVMLAVITGQGIIPSGNVATELTYVTRRAFVPKLVVQLYNASPTAASLLANSQPAYGGVSSVSVPVQGAAVRLRSVV